MTSMSHFRMESDATLGLIASPELDGMYVLSPYVWNDGRHDHALLRLVNRAADPNDKVSRIHEAHSNDGVTFAIADVPVIVPSGASHDADADGCEDPTVVADGGVLHVFYSGWNAATERGTLLVAAGSHLRDLKKQDTVLPSSPRFRNPKEASIVRGADGDWVLFFEYARDDASRIGRASAPGLAGPWTIDEGFVFEFRSDAWDSWHLSPGPIVTIGPGDSVMFYNGADRDGAWRFGWVSFDASYARIVGRSSEPILIPPKPEGDESDIAFVASAVVRNTTIDIYYSIADKVCKRARLVVA